jgi:hypothetical protein
MSHVRLTLISARGGCALALLCASAGVAQAAGFETEYPDNGARALGRAGAFTARADDPTAIYYNPAGLSALRGGDIYVGANGLMLDQGFQPADRTVDIASRRVTLEYGRVEQSVAFFPAPFLAGHFDFEGLPGWDFAAGIYGPASNGHRKFDDQYPVVRATDNRGKDAAGRVAGNRALHLVPNGMLIESELVQIFPTLSAAWQVSGVPLRFGVSLQDSIVLAKLRQGSGGEYPGQAELDVKDLFAPTGILGVHYAPHPRWEIGLSFRPPIAIEATGKAKLKQYDQCIRAANGDCAADPQLSDQWGVEGALELYEADRKTRNDAVTMSFTNPLWTRLGVRYVHRDAETLAADHADDGPGLFDVELDYIFEGDGAHQYYDLNFGAEQVNLPAENGEGTFISMPHLKDRRNYQHTHAVRLGGDYNVLPGLLAVRAGGAYETAVSPEDYTHLDFPSTAKLTGAVGAGLTFDLVDVDLGVSYTHFVEQTVDNSSVRLTDIQKPRSEWAVIGDGTFDGRYLVIGLSTSWHL